MYFRGLARNDCERLFDCGARVFPAASADVIVYKAMYELDRSLDGQFFSEFRLHFIIVQVSFPVLKEKSKLRTARESGGRGRRGQLQTHRMRTRRAATH